MKRRKIETVAAALETELGRAPAPKEIAERLEIDLATFWKWKDAVGIHCEAEVPTNSKGQRASRDAENHADPGVLLASQQMVEAEHVGQLRNLIARLPEQQRTTTKSSTFGRSAKCSRSASHVFLRFGVRLSAASRARFSPDH
jgi:DNA-directed RNA polymerase specialized sigma subunit